MATLIKADGTQTVVHPQAGIGNIFYVTERVYKQLCKEYNVMCDF